MEQRSWGDALQGSLMLHPARRPVGSGGQSPPLRLLFHDRPSCLPWLLVWPEIPSERRKVAYTQFRRCILGGMI